MLPNLFGHSQSNVESYQGTGLSWNNQANIDLIQDIGDDFQRVLSQFMNSDIISKNFTHMIKMGSGT